MASQPQSLAENTNLTVEEAELLLENRELSGNPENHEHFTILLTEDEVIVETESLFNNSDTKSAIELGIKSEASVNSIRGGDSLGGGHYLSGAEDEE